MNVFVELDQNGAAIRIFRNHKAMLNTDPKNYHGVGYMPKRLAVSEIRRQIFDRTEGNCEWCSDIISERTMHMHEAVHRGQGGEISLANSVGICSRCHFDIGHGDRKTRFGENNETIL